MSKNIWIINEYAGSQYHGMSFRHYYLAKEFINLNYNTTIITASYSHFLKKFPNMKNRTYKLENIDGIDYLWIKVLKYSNSFDKKRIIKWFEFMIKLFFISTKIKNKPDYIICSPTAPFSILPSYYLSKKFKAKLIFEVRDIWPLTLIELGKFSKNHPFIVFMGWFEKFALKKSDILISNLQNYKKHIKNLDINKNNYWISNGIFLDEMNNIELLSKDIEQQIPKNKFIIGYTGTIGRANAIDYLLGAAKLMHNKNIIFLIVGDGKEKSKLVKQYKNSKNIIFINPIKKQQIQSILKFFDICYIGLQKENLFKYGVSPNKLFDYMYSAKPIIYAIDSGKSNIVKLANCGISIEAENTNKIKETIYELYSMSKEEKKILGDNGKKYVLEHFTYTKLANKFIKAIEA